MRVTVRYAAQARDAAGTAEEAVEVEGSRTVRELLVHVARAHGSPLRGFLLRDDGAPHPSVLVVVGDEQVRVDDPRALPDGAVVSLWTPISGG
jgi:molybdopterin converting factor small subunit